jgi:hypothetical protein
MIVILKFNNNKDSFLSIAIISNNLKKMVCKNKEKAGKREIVI